MKNLFGLENNQKILKASGLYSLLWGIFITMTPKLVLNFFNVPFNSLVEFWQLFGMIVGVMGISLFIASYDPGRHWGIVFVVFLGNLMGTFVFTKALVTGSLPTIFGVILLLSSSIWLLPFYFILQSAYDENVMEESEPKKFHDLIKFVRTSQNKSLLELSHEKDVLLVFVRHFGCTFCRETVSEMAKIEEAVNGKNLTQVFVHMSDTTYGDEFFSKYYTHAVHHVSDPQRILYRSLGLKRGTLFQILGPSTWLRGIYAGIFKGHGLGSLEGDSLQLGGIFILSRGQVVFEQKASCASQLFQLNTLPEI